MYTPKMVLYTIQPGDNLTQIAKYYRTSDLEILSLNPGVSPNNLKAGTRLVISPGTKDDMPSSARMPLYDPATPAYSGPNKEINLVKAMRLVWEQHVYWTRMLIISIAERLKDQADVAKRLLENPNDLAKVFSEYYPPDVTNTIAQLVTEHLQIGAALITALRDGKTQEAEKLDRQWYANADKIAKAFSDINPYYSREEVRYMFYRHLDITKREVAMRLAGNYPADIAAFDAAEKEMMAMADMFTEGLIKQFPQKFY